MSKFLMYLFVALPKMGRGIIREQVCAGVRAAKARGTRFRTPQARFRRDEALKLRPEGMSWRNVAKTLNLPMSTVIDACSEIPPKARRR
jgi:DNA invertase Pin-like site-specific DNA recombinase